jgi:uncharacterized membrane protein YjfL (UPF0719 family)
MDPGDVGYDLLAALLYGLVGLALMGLGWVVLDVLIPGNLADLICRQRRRDAGLVTAAGTISIAAIVTASIAASDDDLAEGLAETAAFGGIGLLLLALAFVGVDRITPGSLGEILADEHDDEPTALVTSAALLGVAAIIVAAVS